MHASRFRPPAARRFAWLLWLGLLLPVAQLAAATHALSHARQATSRDDGGPQAPHAGHCDLCLAAGAIGGAAPTGDAALLVLAVHGASLPEAAVATLSPAVPVVVYRSRAPPVAR